MYWGVGGISFFKGHAFNPLFYWFFWCFITNTCFSSYFVRTSLCVSVANLPILWPLPGSRQTPYLGWGMMPAQRWLVQLFTWLLFCPNNPEERYLLVTAASDTLLLALPALWQLMRRSTLYSKEFEGAHRYSVHREPSRAFAMGVSAERPPCPLWTVRPISLGRRNSSEAAGLFTKELSAGRSWSWEPRSYVCSCKPVRLAAHRLPLHTARVGPFCSFVRLAWG